MEAKPPKKEAGARARQLQPQLSRDEQTLRRRILSDEHVRRYIIFLRADVSHLDADSAARRLWEIARSRYRQFRKKRDPEMRRLAWSALQACAAWLQKRKAGR